MSRRDGVRFSRTVLIALVVLGFLNVVLALVQGSWALAAVGFGVLTIAAAQWNRGGDG